MLLTPIECMTTTKQRKREATRGGFNHCKVTSGLFIAATFAIAVTQVFPPTSCANHGGVGCRGSLSTRRGRDPRKIAAGALSARRA